MPTNKPWTSTWSTWKSGTPSKCNMSLVTDHIINYWICSKIMLHNLYNLYPVVWCSTEQKQKLEKKYFQDKRRGEETGCNYHDYAMYDGPLHYEYYSKEGKRLLEHTYGAGINHTVSNIHTCYISLKTTCTTVTAVKIEITTTRASAKKRAKRKGWQWCSTTTCQQCLVHRL